MKLKKPGREVLQPNAEKKIMVAWERFLNSGELPPDEIRRLIEKSWWRCQAAGVDPGRWQAGEVLPAAGVSSLLERHRELIEASVPIMAQARDYLAESGTVMVLTDPAGWILETEGDPATRDAACDIHLVAGANWSENACGTNAIGTAASTGESVQVHAAEHFCEGIKRWTCSATVIRDPANGEVLGVLDVSGLSSTFNQHSLALVVAAAGRIEACLAVREMEIRQRLLENGSNHFSRSATGGMIYYDRKGRFVRADARATASLSALGIKPDLKQDVTIDAFHAQRGEPGRRGRSAKLPDWLRAEWVEKIVEGGEQLGTVILVPEPASASRSKRPQLSAEYPPATAPNARDGLDGLIGGSEALAQAVQKARRLAELDVPVLLQGETGVGKEVFAHGIHDGGRQPSGPFVALNCGGLARDILASELFGYVDGAFTGAKRSGMIGKIEAANGGTLFLDEIGEMPLDLQPYLLRVLEGGEVYPLGDTRPRKVHFRLIAASNRDLRAEVAAGRFRMDLFYRLSVTALQIPPLRERTGDIGALVEHFTRAVALRHGVPIKPCDAPVLAALEAYDWPGNVRELRNVIEGMMLTADGDRLTEQDLPAEIARLLPTAPAGGHLAVTDASLEASERAAICSAILKHSGNLTQTAKDLRISKSTLYLKLRKYGLDRSVQPGGNG